VLQRIICGTTILLLAFATAKIVESRKPSSDACDSLLAMNESNDLKDIKVSIRSVHKHPDRWEIELETRNDSQQVVFVLTDPIQENGKRGPYIETDEADSTILDLSVRFYEGPDYLLFANPTRVKLMRLDPQTSHVEKYTLTIPLRSTIPPYRKNREQAREKQIDHSQIRTLKVSVGVLPDDEGIRDLLRRKTFGPFSNGGDVLAKGSLKGKSLIEAQAIVNASYRVPSGDEAAKRGR
jgi:hypothetical protein